MFRLKLRRKDEEIEWVFPESHEIVKFFPAMPPEKGDRVLVNGRRAEVLKVKLRWKKSQWFLDGVKVRYSRAQPA